jgi:hypothetical protein
MNDPRRGWPSVSGLALCVAGLLVAGATEASAWAAEAGRLRIKNGHHMTVALGKTRQEAIGVRPEKKIWQIDLDAELIGAAADFQDVTPSARGERWSIPVESGKLALDATRFLPSHVYRLEIRRARLVLGTAFVYLYPPPAEQIRYVVLDDRIDKTEPADGASGLDVIPKSGL